MSDAATSEPPPPATTPASNIFGQRRKILVVDDDPALAEALAASLASEQTQVAVCATTTEAVREIDQRKPDVVVLDVSLPDGDAFDVLEAVRLQTPTPAVVAISGVATPLDSFRLGRLGAASFLTKPFTSFQLAEAIEQAITGRVNLRILVRDAVGRRSVRELEQELRTRMVEEAMARASGSRTRAAALLGVSRQLLQFMLRRSKAKS
jgi:two-component system response regulator RegA